MADLKDLGPGEFEVMDVLWSKGEASVKDVQGALPKERQLAYTTVSTMLTRLREKGYVEAEEKNFRYVFRPLVPKETVVRRKLDEMIRRVLGGDLEPIAAYIAENRNLTLEQVAALEEIVRSRKREDR